MPRTHCGRFPRRQFLADMGLGFTGLVLNAMLTEDKLRASSPLSPQGRVVGRDADGGLPSPQRGRGVGGEGAPRVENVIWLFMMGGVSHIESFDPKPALNRYAGMRISDTDARSVLDRRDSQ